MDYLKLNKIGEYINKNRDFVNTNIKIIENIKPTNPDGTIILTKATIKEYASTEYLINGIDNVNALLSILDEITSSLVLVRIHSNSVKVYLIFNTKDTLLYTFIYSKLVEAGYIKITSTASNETQTITFHIEDSIDGMADVIGILDFINKSIIEKAVMDNAVIEEPIENPTEL